MKKAHLGPGLILEAQRGGVLAVDQHDAFQAAGARRNFSEHVGQKRVAAGDGQQVAVELAGESAAGGLGDIGGGDERNALLGGVILDGAGEGMAGILFEAGDQREDFVLILARRGKDPGELRPAVGEGAGLVEKNGLAGGEAFQDRWVADDDAPPGGKRDGADDRNGNGDQKRAGRGDDKDGEEARRIAGELPCGKRDRQRRGVYQAPMRSARRCMCGRSCWASCMMR